MFVPHVRSKSLGAKEGFRAAEDEEFLNLPYSLSIDQLILVLKANG